MPQYDPGNDFRLRMHNVLKRIQETKPPTPTRSANPIDGIISVANNILNKVSDSPVGRVINRASEVLPQLQERDAYLPFGHVRLPEVKIPELEHLELDDRKRDIVKQAVGIDVAQVAGVVPVLGDLVADVIEDTHAEAMRDLLSDTELSTYLKHDKLGPSTMAVARTFMQGRY